MIINKILHDFGEEGLEIDVSTKTYPNKSILIDKEFYYDNEGKVTARGPQHFIITRNRVKLYLGRYIAGLEVGNLKKVVHSDGLHCDFRKNNLLVVDAGDVDRKKKSKSVREYHLEWIREHYNFDDIEEDSD